MHFRMQTSLIWFKISSLAGFNDHGNDLWVLLWKIWYEVQDTSFSTRFVYHGVPKHTIHKYKEELLQAQNLMFQQAHSCALILFQVSRKTEGAHFY